MAEFGRNELIQNQTWIKGQAITPLTLPEATGTSVVYSMSGTPPAGVSFNAATRQLTGTPTETGLITATYTATDAGGAASLTFVILVSQYVSHGLVSAKTKLSYSDRSGTSLRDVIGFIQTGEVIINALFADAGYQTPIDKENAPESFKIAQHVAVVWVAYQTEDKPRNDDRASSLETQYTTLENQIRERKLILPDASPVMAGWAVEVIDRHMAGVEIDEDVRFEAITRLMGYGSGPDALTKSGVRGLLAPWKKRNIAIIDHRKPRESE